MALRKLLAPQKEIRVYEYNNNYRKLENFRTVCTMHFEQDELIFELFFTQS